MKPKIILSISLCCILISSSFAQQKKVLMDVTQKKGEGQKSELFTTECMGERNEPSADLKWRSVLSKKKIAHFHETKDSKMIEQMKVAKGLLKVNDQKLSESDLLKINKSSETPEIGNNFLGNTNNGSSPLDNSIAISNGGWIVSVANTTIEYDDVNGNNTYFSEIASFINDPQISNVCDPVVKYDPEADRFIFFAQECSGNSSNSFLLVFFSQTNNPNDGWWYYKLTGNPDGDDSWFDYPKLAISNNELYITGNLFGSTSGTFNQSLIYQIDKNAGYNGAFLNWQYWNNIDGDPFTLCPVSYGHGDNYGPGIFLVATAAGGSSTVKLYDLTNDIGQGEELNYFEISRDAYSVAANCPQLGSTCALDNGDCRTLSGFYLDGIIHYVFTSDVGSGWNGINYNRLNANTGAHSTSTFGVPGTFDYAYPSVASFTNSVSNKSVMIGFGAVSSNIFPEVRVVNCDNNMNWSSSTLVKASNSFSCYTNTTEERWGDYTGISRKHNNGSPSIWLNGAFGTSNNVWNTWISEVHGSGVIGIEDVESENADLSVYPNPIADIFNLEFELGEPMNLNINILDVNGKVVKELYRGIGTPGINIFSFNKSNLTSGTYFVSIQSENKIITNEKIIISN